jgi:para-nitrobenzyl esterase
MAHGTHDFALGRRSFIGASAMAAAGTLLEGAWTKVEAQRVRGLASSPVVGTVHGRIRGYVDDGVYAFRGVPYGADTSGANRFMPPRAPEPWLGVRDTVELGLRAPQPQDWRIPEFSVNDRAEPAGEDCLRINVWSTGLSDNGRRPVMVWLHGGGFNAGSAGFEQYDGANLARKHDVVVVGVNHRLNGFGFTYLAEIGGEKYRDSGNVGMLDVVAVLEWVRDNVERFGGDPGSVTVFGQSGGGGKVSTLYGMPAAQGLFHRGIAMSGSRVRSTLPDAATATARRVMERLNVTTADELQQVEWRTLRTVIQGAGGYGPVVDAGALPAHPFDPEASALSATVPMMIGSTETETTWSTDQLYDHLTDAELRVDVARELRTTEVQADKIISLYRRNRPWAGNLDLWLILETDNAGYRTGTDTQAIRKVRQGTVPVYRYYFQWYSPVRDGQLRSMHTMDIPFVFENVEIASTLLGTGADLQPLADQMSASWVAFARTGDPNNSLIPEWQPFTERDKVTLVFSGNTQAVNDPYGAEKAAIAAARGTVADSNND